MAAQYALSFVALAILARLVSPAEFGQAVLAITIADFLVVLASMSLATALLREAEETLPTAFTAALVLEVSVLGCVLIISVPAFLILQALASSTTAWIFLAVIGGRVLALVGHLYQAIVERRLAFARLASILLGAQIISLLAAVGVAAAGGGAWAVATRDMTTGIAGFVLSLAIARWTITRQVDRAKIHELWRFGTAMIGSRLGDLVFHRLDNLVVAAFSGSRALGLYNQAYVLAEVGNKLFVPVIAYLPLNLYAKIQGEDARVQRVYSLITFWIARAVAPIGVVFLLVPTQLLTTLFGAAWAPAAGILRGLAAYTILLPMFEHARVLLIANGAVGSVLVARGIQLAVFIPAVVLLTWLYGGEGASGAVAAAMIIGTVAMFHRARRFAELRAGDWIPALASACVAAAAGGGVLWLVNWAASLELLAVVTVVLVAYVLSTLALEGQRAVASGRELADTLRTSGTHEGQDKALELMSTEG